MEQERWQSVFLARVAEQAERYNDMVEEMKKVVRMDVELTLEERSLLSIGYKNVVGAKRESWWLLSSIEQKEGNEQNLKKIKEYKQKVEDELTNKCEEVLSVIDKHLLPSSSTSESTAFFHKMKGDYYRYLAEIKVGNDRKDARDQSLKAYEAATSIAESDLSSINQVRLGLALNFSVLYYEIFNSTDRAYYLAKDTYDEAIAELDNLNKESYKDSTLILQLIRDNLILWVHQLRDDGDARRQDSMQGSIEQ